MECCNEERATPFCPQCGKSLMGSLSELLKHVEKTAQQYRKRHVKLENCPRSEMSDDDQYWLNKREQVVFKWEQWYEDLRELIATQGAKE